MQEKTASLQLCRWNSIFLWIASPAIYFVLCLVVLHTVYTFPAGCSMNSPRPSAGWEFELLTS